MSGLRPQQGAVAAPPPELSPAGGAPARRRAGVRRGYGLRPYWLTIALAALGLTAGTYVVNLFGAQEARMAAVRAEQASLVRRLEAARQRHQQLQAEIARLQTDEYIETVAREQLGYIRPGETPYMALDPRAGRP